MRLLNVMNAGIESEMKLSQKSRMRIINVSMILAMLNILLYNASYFFFAKDLALSMIFIPMICVLGIAFSWWLNKTKQRRLGILLFQLFSMGSVFYISRYYLGPNFGYQYYFLVFGMLPFVYYETKERLISVFFSISNFFLFLYLDAGNFNYVIVSAHRYYNQDIAATFKISNRIIAFVTLAVVMWIFDWIINKDEEALVKALEKANYNATYDYLTKVLNRRALTEIMHKKIDAPDIQDKTFSLIMIDIDDFKKINDTYGHMQGDAVLEALCRTVERSLPIGSQLARWGGEEFLVYSDGMSIEDGIELAEIIRSDVASALINCDIKITISLGIASRENGETFSSLLNKADVMLYRAKAAGKNTVGNLI